MGTMRDLFVQAETFVLFLACITIKNRLPVPLSLELGFYRTNLQELLTAMHVTHLILAGVTTEVCVQTTMREANDRGYECLLVEDATASYFPTFKQATLEMIRAQGAIVGWTATAADVLRALEQCEAQ